jgi:hypothetical protein
MHYMYTSMYNYVYTSIYIYIHINERTNMYIIIYLPSISREDDKELYFIKNEYIDIQYMYTSMYNYVYTSIYIHKWTHKYVYNNILTIDNKGGW